jgi:hypothetical protein
VSSAFLKLRIESTTVDRTHGVHRVLKAWTESSVTWLTTDGSTTWTGGGTNGPDDSTGTASATANTGTTPGAIITWSSAALTADVAALVGDPSLNHGWLIREAPEGNVVNLVTYDARESSSIGAVAPQLEVTYTLTDGNCDDDDVCTTDTCTAGGCGYSNNNLPCDDELFCNGADTCADGSCSLHAGDPCSGADGDTDCAETCDERYVKMTYAELPTLQIPPATIPTCQTHPLRCRRISAKTHLQA